MALHRVRVAEYTGIMRSRFKLKKRAKETPEIGEPNLSEPNNGIAAATSFGQISEGSTTAVANTSKIANSTLAEKIRVTELESAVVTKACDLSSAVRNAFHHENSSGVSQNQPSVPRRSKERALQEPAPVPAAQLEDSRQLRSQQIVCTEKSTSCDDDNQENEPFEACFKRMCVPVELVLPFPSWKPTEGREIQPSSNSGSKRPRPVGYPSNLVSSLQNKPI